MDPNLAVVVYAAASKRVRAFLYIPGHILFPHAERRSSSGDCESTRRRFRAFDRRRYGSPLLAPSTTPLDSFVIPPELPLITSISFASKEVSPVYLYCRDLQPCAAVPSVGPPDVFDSVDLSGWVDPALFVL